MGLSFCWFL